MTNDQLSTLDAQALSARLRALAGDERNVQADFLLHLDALDLRRGYAELGYPSLWEYCLRALHLREGAAGRRIGAMRVLRRFPSLIGALRDGRLCLSRSARSGQCSRRRTSTRSRQGRRSGPSRMPTPSQPR